MNNHPYQKNVSHQAFWPKDYETWPTAKKNHFWQFLAGHWLTQIRTQTFPINKLCHNIQEASPFFKPLHAAHVEKIVAQYCPPRIGKLFECIVRQLLEQHPYIQIVASNMVITQATRTLGEIDFILKNQFNQTLMHWEISHKFYLETSIPITITDHGTTFHSHCVGPDPTDCLERKIYQLQTKQFPILLHPQVLCKFPTSASISQFHLSQYWLFKPLFEHPEKPTTISYSKSQSNNCSSTHPIKIWLHHHSLPLLPTTWLWQKAPRSMYLVPHLGFHQLGSWLSDDWLNTADFIKLLNNPYPELVYCLIEPTKLALVYIIPNRWPNPIKF